MVGLRPLALFALLLFVGCGGERLCLSGPCPTQSAACRDFITCFNLTGGTSGSLDSTYGPKGTCWTSNQNVVNACTEACTSALASEKVSFPDAGCR